MIRTGRSYISWQTTFRAKTLAQKQGSRNRALKRQATSGMKVMIEKVKAHWLQVTVITLLCVGCASTTDDLLSKPGTEKRTLEFNQNYQEVYQSVRSMAIDCQDGYAGAYTTSDINAELYSDLGYAEISQRLNTLGANNYYWFLKIERLGPLKSRMTVFSGNTLNNSAAIQRLEAWANGSKRCNGS